MDYKRTNRTRANELTAKLAKCGMTNYFVALAPKGYSPYRLYTHSEDGNAYTIFGGYFREIKAAVTRMCFAAQTGRNITPYDIYGC